MGCKAFTPHLVGLAKELETKPFHLLASYNQRANPEQAKHEIFQNGLALLSPNVTVSMHAGHPGVKGTGYVPYYLVFDHHGDLAYHHQGGPYHGGDGTAVLERVRKLVDQVPAIYLGKQPFEANRDLALALRKGVDLNVHLLALSAAHKEDAGDAEVMRMVAGVERYKRGLFQRAERLLGMDFNAGRSLIVTASKVFAGTHWAPEFKSLAKSLRSPKAQKFHGTASRDLGKVLKRFEKLEQVPGNGGTVSNPFDPAFRKTNQSELVAIRATLTQLRDKGPSTPSGKIAVQLLALLQ